MSILKFRSLSTGRYNISNLPVTKPRNILTRVRRPNIEDSSHYKEGFESCNKNNYYLFFFFLCPHIICSYYFQIDTNEALLKNDLSDLIIYISIDAKSDNRINSFLMVIKIPEYSLPCVHQVQVSYIFSLFLSEPNQSNTQRLLDNFS